MNDIENAILHGVDLRKIKIQGVSKKISNTISSWYYQHQQLKYDGHTIKYLGFWMIMTKKLLLNGIAHVHNPFYKHGLTPTKEWKANNSCYIMGP